MSPRHHRRAVVTTALIGLVAVVSLASCSLEPAPAKTTAPNPGQTSASTEPTTAAPSVEAPSPAAPSGTTHSPTQAADPTFAKKPSKTTRAGTVSDAAAVSASGNGDSAVAYTVKGKIAAVVTVDCSACSGPVTVTGPGRSAPFGKVPRGGSGAYLMSPMANDSPRQQVWIQANGPWKLTVSSWNTAPRRQGVIHEKGSRVFFVDGKYTEALFQWKRAHKGDKVQVRYFRAGVDRPLLFGGDDPTYKESQKITTPGVLSVQTEGEWTFTPH